MVSLYEKPGSRKCTCTSQKPGRTAYLEKSKEMGECEKNSLAIDRIASLLVEIFLSILSYLAILIYRNIL
jgi:hypothetical protein